VLDSDFHTGRVGPKCSSETTGKLPNRATLARKTTFWDSRYKSSLIQAETYLLTCMRYIELNPAICPSPVRAEVTTPVPIAVLSLISVARRQCDRSLCPR
jgi:hypothetical protein